MSNDTVRRRATSDQMLATVRDKYAPDEMEYQGAFFNSIAQIALEHNDINGGDQLALAGACILIVKDLLEEQGASQ